MQYFQPLLSYNLSLRSLFCLFLSDRLVHPSCKRSRKFRVGWVDGSIHFISKECIISPKFLQKALVWLSNLDGELR